MKNDNNSTLKVVILTIGIAITFLASIIIFTSSEDSLEYRWYKGEANAPVTLEIFSDFECPGCSAFSQTTNQIYNEFDGQIKIVYKHANVIPSHQWSMKTAIAAETAGAQGKFWEMHDKLFQNYGNFSNENIKMWANEIGLDTEEFNKDFNSNKYQYNVEDDYDEAVSRGINATPSLFINGEKFEKEDGSHLSFQVLSEEIRKYLQ